MIRVDRLTLMADSLLAMVERDPEYPCYGEESFARKVRNAQKRNAQLPLPTLDPAGIYLSEQEWLEITKDAGLTRRQQEVFAARLAGDTFEAIGHAGGHTKQGAQSIFRQAVKKVLAIQCVYPYAGLAEVYRSEVRRGFGIRKR